MLKSALGISRKTYTCLFVPQLLRMAPKVWSSGSGFHTGKELFDASETKTEQSSPVELPTQDSSSVHDNIKESSFFFKSVIPTIDTPNMLVDGVPFKDLPIIHILATWNNTHCTVTDANGKHSASRASAGTVGFKNAKKRSTVAAQAVGLQAGQNAMAKGIKNVRVTFKGIGSGRLPALKGLEMAGLNIISLTDVTAIPHNGCRPRKQRRL